MKTTIEIADDLLTRAKDTARKEHKTLRRLLEEILRDGLATRMRRRKKYRMRDCSVGGEGLQPGVDPTRLVEYAYEDRIA